MLESPVVHDLHPAAGEVGDVEAEVASRADTVSGADEGEQEFGAGEPTRFGADVEYRGRAEGHDYLVRVRHRFFDTSFTVLIDGIEHDPKAEEKAGKKNGGKKRAGDGDDAGDDGLQFRLEENFTVTYCTVRRPKDEGALADAEVIAVRTGGLGGAGEVDIRHGLERTLLFPEDDSPSAVRDVKRTEHPARYALVAALAKAAGLLIPILGLGALFSGILRPVLEGAREVVRPVTDAIAHFVDPIRQGVADLLRPIQEFLDAVFAPVREFVADVLRPVVTAWDWIWGVLLGWIPDLSLPFSVPGWVVDVAVPVIVVLVVFVATLRSLRRRRERLDATRAATMEGPEGTDGSRTSVDRED